MNNSHKKTNIQYLCICVHYINLSQFFMVIAAIHLSCISCILFYITSLKLLKVLLTTVTRGKLSV